MKDLAATLGTIPLKHLKYTQEFGFSVPIHSRVESRCVHKGDNEPFIDADIQDELAEFLSNDENMYDEDVAESAEVRMVITFNLTFERKITNKLAQSRVLDSFLDLNHALGSLTFPDDQLRSFRSV